MRDPVLTKDALDNHVVGKGFCSETADIFLRLSDPRTQERRTFNFPDRNNVPWSGGNADGNQRKTDR